MYLPGTFVVSLEYEANVLSQTTLIPFFIDPCSITTFIEDSTIPDTTISFTAAIVKLEDYWSKELGTDTCEKQLHLLDENGQIVDLFTYDDNLLTVVEKG
jgi:hypothetical protein